MSNTIDSLHRILGTAASVADHRLVLKDPAALASTRMDELVRLAQNVLVHLNLLVLPVLVLLSAPPRGAR